MSGVAQAGTAAHGGGGFNRAERRAVQAGPVRWLLSSPVGPSGLAPHGVRLWLLAALLAAAPAAGAAQSPAAEPPGARLYAERAAMVALDRRCALFDAEERIGLQAFVAQARGALLRAGVSEAAVAGYARTAAGAAATRPCAEPVVLAEAARVKRAFRAWRNTLSASYPGVARSWQVSRAGVDGWRAWQELGGGVRAGFLRTERGAAFAVETPDTEVASARLFLRDAARLGPPRSGGRLLVPLRAGTTSHQAAVRRAAITKVRVEAAPRAGTLLVFSDATTAAVANADPRDSFDVELVTRAGTVRTVVVEVGDITAAWASAAVR
jgi:hypothetical protein